MPSKIDIVNNIDKILTALIISIVASFCRLMFYKNETFIKTLFTFVGGIAFGTLVGYLVSTIPSMAGYDKIFTAVAAIGGKEIVKLLIVDFPLLVKKLANKKAGIINDTKSNSTNVD